MDELLKEAQTVVNEIRKLIDSLPPMQRMDVYLVADCIRRLVAAEGEKGMLAMTLIGAELQLQAAEQEYSEHERVQLAEALT